MRTLKERAEAYADELIESKAIKDYDRSWMIAVYERIASVESFPSKAVEPSEIIKKASSFIKGTQRQEKHFMLDEEYTDFYYNGHFIFSLHASKQIPELIERQIAEHVFRSLFPKDKEQVMKDGFEKILEDEIKELQEDRNSERKIENRVHWNIQIQRTKYLLTKYRNHGK